MISYSHFWSDKVRSDNMPNTKENYFYVQSQQRRHPDNVWNISKLTLKTLERGHIYCYLWTDSTHSSGVDFEQANPGWIRRNCNKNLQVFI